MTRHSSDDELLRSYLRGEIPEVDELEKRLLKEDDLFDLLEAIEAELLAAVSRDELLAEEKEWVLRRLASSFRGRERLALARSLNALADELPEAQEPLAPVVPIPHRVPKSRPVWSDRAAAVRHRFSRPRIVWSGLAAAASLILAVSLWYASPRSPEPIPDQRQIDSQEDATPPESEDQNGPEQRPADQRQEGADQRQPDQRHQEEDRGPVERHQPVKAVFTLSLATLRGAEEEEKVLEVSEKTGKIELQLDLEGLDGFESYRAIIKNADHLPVWEKSGLRSRQVNWDSETRGPALVLNIPAEKLPVGRYEVVVAADTETLAQVFFMVKRKQ